MNASEVHAHAIFDDEHATYVTRYPHSAREQDKHENGTVHETNTKGVSERA